MQLDRGLPSLHNAHQSTEKHSGFNFLRILNFEDEKIFQKKKSFK